jgi:hypothetical protein
VCLNLVLRVFQVREITRRKGTSPKIEGLHPTGARADADKSVVICGVTSRSADYVKT